MIIWSLCSILILKIFLSCCSYYMVIFPLPSVASILAATRVFWACVFFFSCAQLLQLCPILYDPMDCRLTWLLCPWDSPDKNTGVVAMSSSRKSSQLRDQTHVSCGSCIAGGEILLPLSHLGLNLRQYCFCFMFWFFGHKACGILAPWLGIKPVPPALEGSLNHWTAMESQAYVL